MGAPTAPALAPAGGDAAAAGGAVDKAPLPTAADPQLSFRRRLINILMLGLGWCLSVSALFIQVRTPAVAIVVRLDHACM